MTQTMQLSFKFNHGLGDCANAAHLFKLYIDRGYDVIVECTPDKAPLFKAAGCTITDKPARTVHQWLHPAAPGTPAHNDHWSGNKTAWNTSAYPAPDIGWYHERWGELLNVKLSLAPQVGADTREMVSDYFKKLSRPIFLCHWQANTSADRKDISHAEQERMISRLLDRTDGTVITLDWDNRSYRYPSARFRHLQDDWKPLSVLELSEAISQADLLVGVDSGPLHLSRFTDTAALGIWRDHVPSHFALPRRLTAHCCPPTQQPTTQCRRLAYNLLECPGGIDDCADHAVRMVSRKLILPDATSAEDCLMQHLLDKLRTKHFDRNRSFDMLFSEATWRNLKRWVSTGCIRSPEDWTAGMSDYVFGLYLSHSGGHLDVVELDQNNIFFAQPWVQSLPVALHHANSLDYLAKRQENIDVFYSDSLDADQPGCAEHCLEEVKLALPLLQHDERAMILIDDSPHAGGGMRGKGRLAIPFLVEQGWRVLYHGYQCLLSRFEPNAPSQPCRTS